jgi:hypothetical protein
MTFTSTNATTDAPGVGRAGAEAAGDDALCATASDGTIESRSAAGRTTEAMRMLRGARDFGIVDGNYISSEGRPRY